MPPALRLLAVVILLVALDVTPGCEKSELIGPPKKVHGLPGAMWFWPPVARVASSSSSHSPPSMSVEPVGTGMLVAGTVTLTGAPMGFPPPSLNWMVTHFPVDSRPHVVDFENIAEDSKSMAGFFRNKVTRIFAVFIVPQLASTAGTWLTLWYVANY